MKTKLFEDMKVRAWKLTPEEWGDENDPKSDWSLANLHATFSHKDACEFIFHVAELDWQPLKEKGFSGKFIQRCIDASNAGYHYVCFYT